MPPTYSEPIDPTTLDPRILVADLRSRLMCAERQLSSIPAEIAVQPLSPGKWSIQQTVGHLIDSCANNLQRLIRMQLTPALNFPGYQQEEWVQLQRYDLLSWPDVLSLWLALNRHFAHTIQHVDPSCFTHTWFFEDQHHTLGFVLVDYLGHLDHHLRQLPNYDDAM